MAMGYRTLVGDLGSSLSSGQRQRVLLARALYHKPRLLIMDEGTSHIDVATEARIMAALRASEVTCILAAHRPETLGSADCSFFLVNGMLKELVATERRLLGTS